MYLDHFGFRAAPFQDTPDQSMFWSSSGSNHFQQILHNIQTGTQLQIVVGEPGLGKTMLCRKLLNTLRSHRSRYQVVCMPYPKLSLDDILPASQPGKRHQVLLIDEAQALPIMTLRTIIAAIRSRSTPLSVLMFGQTELRYLLSGPISEQIQTIEHRYSALGPLDASGTHHYSRYRIHQAGGDLTRALPDNCQLHLHNLSHGIPRQINALMRKALLLAAQEKSHSLQTQHLKNASNPALFAHLVSEKLV